MNRNKLVIGLLLIVASATLGFSAFQKSLTPYVSFREAQASNSEVQVSGDVIRSRVKYDIKTGTLMFPLKDHTGAVMNVVSYKGKPNNFDQSEKVVAIGRVENGTFHADRLLTKCPSKYEAEPGQAGAKPVSNPSDDVFNAASNSKTTSGANAGGY